MRMSGPIGGGLIKRKLTSYPPYNINVNIEINKPTLYIKMSTLFSFVILIATFGF